ncbi:putative Anticodon-binding domain, protein Lsm12 [Septoria linicola]|nr:putative Anticodon-binding domain, protein Lsm12 [Septoria linicola]
MADVAKRNAGKVATPKSTGSPLPNDLLETATKAIGGRVRVTNTLSTTFEGTLYTVDPALRLIALNTTPRSSSSTNPSSVPGDYRIIPIAAIRDFQILSLGDSSYLSQTAPTRIDTPTLENRLEKRVGELKAEKQHKGENVTEEAQRLYDALRKLLVPIRWHGGAQGTQMILHDAIIVDAPFEPANCRAPADKQDLLPRTKRMIEDQRKKLGV